MDAPLEQRNTSTADILSTLHKVRVGEKRVHFREPTEEDVRRFKKDHPPKNENEDDSLVKLCLRLHTACLVGNRADIESLCAKLRVDQFQRLLEMPCKLEGFKGYKALHLAVESNTAPFIGFFHEIHHANFRVTIDAPDSEIDGFTPLHLAIYKFKIDVVRKFAELPTLNKLLRSPCKKGPYKGFQALHIALASYAENIGSLEESAKKIIDVLSGFGANWDAIIDNPKDHWHKKSAREAASIFQHIVPPEDSSDSIAPSYKS